MNYVSAGESHGKTMTAILSGFPAGLRVDIDLLKSELRRRRSGKGVSLRLEAEHDDVQIISGVMDMLTTGAPIAFLIDNEEGESLIDKRVIEKGFPRPGHTDLVSFQKYGYSSVHVGAERASARETVLRVAAGSLCKMLMGLFNIDFYSEVMEIGGVPFKEFNFESESESKKSAGGILKVSVNGVPVGLGSNVQWTDRLDSRISGALMSIPSVKGVYIGDTEIHRKRGVEGIDLFDGSLKKRSSNLYGGIEGGISNGCSIDVTLFFKPVSTQTLPVESFSVFNGEKGKTGGGRNDLWCVERAQVIAESVLAFVIADAFTAKFGCDSVKDIQSSYQSYLKRIG